MFLNNNYRLKDKVNIEQADFVEIFSNAIIAAKDDAMNKIAESNYIMSR